MPDEISMEDPLCDSSFGSMRHSVTMSIPSHVSHGPGWKLKHLPNRRSTRNRLKNVGHSQREHRQSLHTVWKQLRATNRLTHVTCWAISLGKLVPIGGFYRNYEDCNGSASQVRASPCLLRPLLGNLRKEGSWSFVRGRPRR